MRSCHSDGIPSAIPRDRNTAHHAAVAKPSGRMLEGVLMPVPLKVPNLHRAVDAEEHIIKLGSALTAETYLGRCLLS